MATIGLTRQLAEFVAASEQVPLDAKARRLLHTAFVDTVGVILAGRDEPVSRIVTQAYAGGSGPQARVLVGRKMAAVRNAALINATAGHALDYDDIGLMGHPSVVLVPALLAEGEHRHAHGHALLCAYLVGYEIWGELIQRDQDRHHAKGWHPTAVFGTLAAAGAIAALRRLDVTQAQHALGIAASMAGGLIANFGSMAKPYHAGRAAASGIEAVDLAQAGMTASPDTIEHAAGLLAAISPAGNVDRAPCDTPMLQRMRIGTMGLGVKKYPVCFATHRVIDGVLDLRATHGITSEDVRSIAVTLGATQAGMLRNHRPQDALAAKFSLQFAVAAPLVAGRVGLRELTDAFVTQPAVQTLFEKVQIEMVDTVCPVEPTLALSDRVRITLKDDRVLDSDEIFVARGGPESPMLEREIKIKFFDCVTDIPGIDGEALFAELWNLADVTDVAMLSGLPPMLKG